KNRALSSASTATMPAVVSTLTRAHASRPDSSRRSPGADARPASLARDGGAARRRVARSAGTDGVEAALLGGKRRLHAPDGLGARAEPRARARIEALPPERVGALGQRNMTDLGDEARRLLQVETRAGAVDGAARRRSLGGPARQRERSRARA